MSASTPRSVRYLRIALPLLLAGLVVPGGVLALHGTGGLSGVTGAFGAPGGGPAPGSVGGLGLTPEGDGDVAFTVWAETGAPTYYLGALDFVLHAARAVEGSLSFTLSSLSDALPNGTEMWVAAGTAASGASPAGSLTTTPVMPGTSLRGISGLGAPASGMDGLFCQIVLGAANGSQPDCEDSATFSLNAGASVTLVLDLGILTGPQGLPASGAPAFAWSVDLASSL